MTLVDSPQHVFGLPKQTPFSSTVNCKVFTPQPHNPATNIGNRRQSCKFSATSSSVVVDREFFWSRGACGGPECWGEGRRWRVGNWSILSISQSMHYPTTKCPDGQRETRVNKFHTYNLHLGNLTILERLSQARESGTRISMSKLEL